MATIGTLERLTAASLSKTLLASQAGSGPTIAIIDVRDDGMSLPPSVPSPSHFTTAFIPVQGSGLKHPV